MSDGRACAVVTFPSTNVRAYIHAYASLIFALHVKFTSQTLEIRIALCDAIPDKLLPVLYVHISLVKGIVSIYVYMS